MTLDLYSMKYGVQILILIYLILLISVVYCLTHFEKMCSIRKKKNDNKNRDKIKTSAIVE